MEITLAGFCKTFARVSEEYRKSTSKKVLYETICRAAARQNPDHRFLMYKDKLSKIVWHNAETELILKGILQDTILITGVDEETFNAIVVNPTRLLFKDTSKRGSVEPEFWMISFLLLERCFLLGVKE